MSDPVQREYRYRPGVYLLIAMPLFCGLMSGLSGYFALTNRESVSLQGVLEFPAPLANIGAGFAAVLFGLLFVGSAVMVVQALTRRQRVALTATALLVPRGFWSSAEEEIPYGDVVGLDLSAVPDGTQTLTVRHRHGKYPISESLMPSKAAFQELAGFLASRTAAGRGEPPPPGAGRAIAPPPPPA